MPLNPLLTRLGQLLCLLLVALIAGCGTSPKPVDNPYQRGADVEPSVTQSRSAAVVQLQNQALAAINEGRYPLATDYLQRAITIEPRDAWSWHYLADIHWRRGEQDRCIAMLQRAESYADNDSELVDANALLRDRCS